MAIGIDATPQSGWTQPISGLFYLPVFSGLMRMIDGKIYSTYLMASRPYGTLYIGVTGDIITRTTQHRENQVAGFTKRYGIHRLVWFEYFGEIDAAIQREKTMKKWKRYWKINLIERENPHWEDLYPAFFRVEGEPLSQPDLFR
jgi:putative endonuclease